MKEKVSKVDKLIVKYLTRESSKKELDKLEEVLNEDVSNKESLEDYIKINVVSDFVLQKFNIEKTRAAVLNTIAEDKKKVRNAKVFKLVKYAAAAIFAGVLITGFFFKQTLFNTTSVNTPELTTVINAGTNKATLSLEDGSIVVLENETQINVGNATSNGEELTYVPNKKESKKVLYNSLTIPRGGEFALQLADGTKVWLNSESKLKYPVAFNTGETRKVELLYGEAYFDVTSSADNNGSSFKVISQSQEIEVLGTEFNVRAIKNETNVYTTLVEGKVSVGAINATSKKILQPNFQSNFDFNSGTIAVTKIDVYNAVVWKDGIFSFENKSLQEIMDVISRWYDVTVVFENKELKNIKYVGVFGRDQNIVDILSTLKNVGFINNYGINNKTITLK